MNTADLYERLPQPIKDWLAENKPVFETKTVSEIHDILEQVRKEVPNVPVWSPWTVFCRETARCVHSGRYIAEAAWLRPKDDIIQAPDFEILQRTLCIAMDDNTVLGEIYFNVDKPEDSLVWNFHAESWQTGFQTNGMLQFAKGSDRIYRVSKGAILAACNRAEDSIVLPVYRVNTRRNAKTHKEATNIAPAVCSRPQEVNDHMPAVQAAPTPTVQKSRSIMDAATRNSIYNIPADAAEIIETLFGIAGTVPILEPNLQRWRQRMEELFPGQFKKGEQK